MVDRQKEVQGQEAPKLQVLGPVFKHVLSEVRHDLDNLNSHEVESQDRDNDSGNHILLGATKIGKIFSAHSHWQYEGVVIDTGGRVDQEWTENPLYNVLLVRNLLQKELNQFVFVNQLVVGTSNFLEELLDVTLQPLDLHHGYFKWVQLVGFKLV